VCGALWQVLPCVVLWLCVWCAVGVRLSAVAGFNCGLFTMENNNLRTILNAFYYQTDYLPLTIRLSPINLSIIYPLTHEKNVTL